MWKILLDIVSIFLCLVYKYIFYGKDINTEIIDLFLSRVLDLQLKCNRDLLVIFLEDGGWEFHLQGIWLGVLSLACEQTTV